MKMRLCMVAPKKQSLKVRALRHPILLNMHSYKDYMAALRAKAAAGSPDELRKEYEKLLDALVLVVAHCQNMYDASQMTVRSDAPADIAAKAHQRADQYRSCMTVLKRDIDSLRRRLQELSHQ